MNKVLVTGGSGFLGRYIAHEFLQQGWQVALVDQYRNPEMDPSLQIVASLLSDQAENAISDLQPDLVVHAAGTASVQNSLTNADQDFAGNVVLTQGLLNLLKRRTPKSKVIFLSSAAVYGNPKKLPISEDDTIAPISPYGYNKYMSELLIEQYVRIYNLQACSVRIFSAYGSGLRKQLFWDICNKVKTENSVALMGTGNEERDMIHVLDISRAIYLLALKAVFHGEIYNLGSGTSTSIRELTELLLTNFGNIPLSFSGQSRPGDPLHWQADISRLSELGFSCEVGIKEGLAQYAEWFKSLNE